MWFYYYFLIEKAQQARKKREFMKETWGKYIFWSHKIPKFSPAAQIISQNLHWVVWLNSWIIRDQFEFPRCFLQIDSHWKRSSTVRWDPECHNGGFRGDASMLGKCRGDPDRAPLLLLKFWHLVSRSKRIPEFAIMFCKSKHWIATMEKLFYRSLL